jgi:nucleotide-binding universal stress UspA family protein
MFKRILAPTDGSELSVRAVKAAVALAKSINSAVTAVYVMPMFAPMAYPDAVMYSAVSAEEFNADTEREADKALAMVADEARGASVLCEVVKNRHLQPYEGILAAAKQHNCDLILMASHGRRGIKALVLGSETHKVLTHSEIPVLVYR